MNIHHKLRVTKAQISGVLDGLQHFLGDDHQLKLDMLEGETALLDVISLLLAENEDDEGIISALDTQIDERGLRIERAKARIDKRKTAIISLMDCAAETSLKLPEATLSLRTLKPRPKVSDAEQLLDDFVIETIVRKPDTEAIAAAIEGGATIPGVTMTNGGSSLTVRRK